MTGTIRTRQLGSSGIQASVVGLGTWAIGGWMWGGTEGRESVAAIQAAVDEGVSLIDTAPAYGMGKSEELVGEALIGRRDKVVLSTKCGLVWHSQQGNYFFDQYDKPVHRYLGADSIIYEVEQSLKRLRTDYIDHYITHWQDPTTPIAETMEALERLKQQGKIRSIGVSNVSVEELKDYITNGAVDAVQECYSMLDREIEETLLPVCRSNNVSCMGYSSLALGLLSGKIGPERKFDGDDQRKDNPRFSVSNRRKIAAMLEEIMPIAEARNVSIAQTVIAWTLEQPGITFSLCGARNPQQAIENARAAALVLTPEEVRLIGKALSAYSQNMDA